MEPEVINFKTGGVLKSMATDGLIKGDINGNLKGAHSKTDVATPLEILIYVPEGVAATEYQLLHLHESGNAREFRTVTGGIFHVPGGASKDAIEFEGEKDRPSHIRDHPFGFEGGRIRAAPAVLGRCNRLFRQIRQAVQFPLD